MLERALIVVFLTMLSAPALGTIAGLDRVTAEEENRPLASFPRLDGTWASWRAFPDAFTRYFEDNFAFRPLLVRSQAALRLNALDVAPTRTVIKGREGWWFYADDGALEDYAEEEPLTASELEVWRRTLQDTHDWLRARGIAYLFVLAPDKHQVYPEQMPDAIRDARHSRITQLVEHLGSHSSVPVLDLRQALQEAKASERVYHLTDTHWNDAGAYVAYREILSSLSAASPALRPRPRTFFSTRHVTRPGLDLARMMWLTQALEETDVVLEGPRRARIVEPRHPNPHGIDARLVTEVPDPGAPRAVVFRDSFGTALAPFLAEHFSRAVFLWQYNVDPRVIAAERPHVVIHEVVGRRIGTLTPYNPFEQPAQAASGAPGTEPGTRF